MLNFIVMILLGMLGGVIAGLLPGIHTNTLTVAAMAWYATAEMVSPLEMSVMVFSMAWAQAFISFIPSTFLGVPDPDTVASTLPSHQYVNEGRGYEAVMLALIGCVAATIAATISMPLLIMAIKWIYGGIKIHIPVILIMIALITILKEKKRFFAVYTFLIAGVLGMVSLQTMLIKNPLLPLLSGLFGYPSMLFSLKNAEKLAEQKITFPSVDLARGVKSVTTALVTGSVCGFLPSLGSAQAAVLSSIVVRDKSREFYLMITGALSIVNMVIGLGTLYAIGKARNGAVVAVKEILPSVSLEMMMILTSIGLILCFPSALVTMAIARVCSHKMN